MRMLWDGVAWSVSLGHDREHGRPHMGANGVSCPPSRKNGWKISKQKHAKKAFFSTSEYTLRSQIFKIFASGGMGAVTHLTKILHTFLTVSPAKTAEPIEIPFEISPDLPRKSGTFHRDTPGDRYTQWFTRGRTRRCGLFTTITVATCHDSHHSYNPLDSFAPSLYNGKLHLSSFHTSSISSVFSRHL